MGNSGSTTGDTVELRLLLIGLMSTGKTTLLAQLCDETKCHMPTIGLMFELSRMKTANTVLKFVSWYVGGSTKIRPLWRPQYAITDGLIFMVDSRGDYSNYNQRAFTESRKELWLMLREEEVAQHPLLLLANMQDMADAKPVALIGRELGLEDTVDWTEKGLVSGFLMGTHPVAGAASVLRRLQGGGSHLLEYIWKFVGTLEYLTPAAALNGRPCRLQPCCVLSGEGVMDGLEWMKRMCLLRARVRKKWPGLMSGFGQPLSPQSWDDQYEIAHPLNFGPEVLARGPGYSTLDSL